MSFTLTSTGLISGDITLNGTDTIQTVADGVRLTFVEL